MTPEQINELRELISTMRSESTRASDRLTAQHALSYAVAPLLDELERLQAKEREGRQWGSGKIETLIAERDEERASNAALLNLLADIRTAVGDNGKRMQDELVQFLRELKEERDALLEMNLQQSTTIRAYQDAAKEQS